MIGIHKKYGFQLGEQAQDIINNVYQYILKDNLKMYWNTMPHFRIVKLVATATGVSPGTVKRIINKKEPLVREQKKRRKTRRQNRYKNQKTFINHGESFNIDFEQQNKMFQSEVARVTQEIENSYYEVEQKIKIQEPPEESVRNNLNVDTFNGEIEDNKNDVKEYMHMTEKIKKELLE